MRSRLFSSFPNSPPLFFGFAALLALMIGVFVFVSQQAQSYDEMRRSVQERQLLSQIFIDLLDAETGQRGYLLNP